MADLPMDAETLKQKVEEARKDEVEQLRAPLKDELEKLRAFKAYVHKRLDDAGVPVDPPSTHRDEGCRIGGRLDWLLASRALETAALEQLANAPADADVAREIAALKAEREQLLARCGAMSREQLEARIAELEEALRWIRDDVHDACEPQYRGDCLLAAQDHANAALPPSSDWLEKRLAEERERIATLVEAVMRHGPGGTVESAAARVAAAIRAAPGGGR